MQQSLPVFSAVSSQLLLSISFPLLCLSLSVSFYPVIFCINVFPALFFCISLHIFVCSVVTLYNHASFPLCSPSSLSPPPSLVAHSLSFETPTHHCVVQRVQKCAAVVEHLHLSGLDGLDWSLVAVLLKEINRFPWDFDWFGLSPFMVCILSQLSDSCVPKQSLSLTSIHYSQNEQDNSKETSDKSNLTKSMALTQGDDESKF